MTLLRGSSVKAGLTTSDPIDHGSALDPEHCDCLKPPVAGAPSSPLTSFLHTRNAEGSNRLIEASDDEYFEALVEFIQSATGAEHVFAGELWGEDGDRVRSLAHWGKEGRLDHFEYDLLHTPCANVLSQSICVYPAGVAELFPKDGLLAQLNIESYVGVPLSDPSHRPLGLLVLLSTETLSPVLAKNTLEFLSNFQRRCQSVLTHRRTLRELALAQQHVSPGGKRSALPQLVLALSHALHVRVVFIAEHTNARVGCLKTLAFSLDGKLTDNIAYNLDQGPCQVVYQDGCAFYATGVGRKFPGAQVLQWGPSESYLGVVMRSHWGEVLGHLGIVHDRMLGKELEYQLVFRLFREQLSYELERIRHEREQEQASRRLMEVQRTEALGVFAGGLAHDFNNLLVGVMSNAELAHRALGPDCEVAPRISAILEAGQQAARLCRQVLAYAGRARVSKSLFELGPVVQELKPLLVAAIPKTCELSLEISETRNWIKGDSSLVTQVVMNLITNAAEAIGVEKGLITLRVGDRDVGIEEAARCRPAGSLRPGQYATISVKDNGIGISKEIVERIFDPFFTTKQQGHGLGLACLLGILRSHGGGIQVNSALELGSAFTVYLPFAKREDVRRQLPSTVAKTSSTQASPANTTGRQECILVVDDESVVRDATAAILAQEGYDTQIVCDGREALTYYAEHRDQIDCVLLDLSMPRMGGLEALAALRELNSEVKVLLCTGYAECEGQNDTLTSTAPVICKPYEGAKLVAEIRRLLDSPADSGHLVQRSPS